MKQHWKKYYCDHWRYSKIEGKKCVAKTFYLQLRQIYTLRKTVLFFVRIQVQYRKSVQNFTFSSTNLDLFLKKEHFFQKRTFLIPKKEHLYDHYVTGFFRVFVLRVFVKLWKNVFLSTLTNFLKSWNSKTKFLTGLENKKKLILLKWVKWK
jgi:hypothetical protein